MSKIIERKVSSSSKKKSNHMSGMKICKSKSSQSASMPINTLMPSGYSFSQRAKLRKFESTVTKKFLNMKMIFVTIR